MTTKNDNDHTPKDGEARLFDAILHEHARAGTEADDAFLDRIDAALDADEASEMPAKPVRRRRGSRRWVWGIGVAATIMLLSVLVIPAVFKPLRRSAEAERIHNLRARSHDRMMAIRPDFPPELIEGTPRPIRLPLQTPEGGRRYVVPQPIPAPEPPDTDVTPPTDPQSRHQPPPVDRERYGQLVDNRWTTPVDAPLSTFSIDVDTASYANLRRVINDSGRIPPDAVRLEEMVNYFDYSYGQSTDAHPFAVHVGNAACPWNPDHQLVRVALKGREMARTERAPANLVFLLDVSGSMNDPRKLPLVIEAFQYLLEEMDASDTISIVVYAGSEGLALPPTACDEPGRRRVESALRSLRAGGSTNGGAGITLAYRLAKENFREGGINRVILATDGDFNVGATEDGGLVKMVEKKAKAGIFLTVLGFGTGNLNDGMMEAITNKGDGAYHYIDTIKEARRVFLEKLMGTLVTIAKDVKIQVEFNPAQVKQYRLIGYANRMLRKEDFSNDKIDAGDIGSGHTVTAFYEVVTGDGTTTPPAERLRYQPEPEATEPAVTGPASREWLTVKLRYKQPEGGPSTLMQHPFIGVPRELNEAGADFRFASSVAMTGMMLRETEGTEDCEWRDVQELASGALGADPHGRRAEFVKLVQRLGDPRRR